MATQNQEINERVARGLGWGTHIAFPGRWIPPNGIKKVEEGVVSTEVRDSIPDYCTDIGAAWGIVEKCPMALVPFGSGRWYATTMDVPETENECFEIWTQTNCATENECSCGCCIVADTAPMAICLAYLKLHGE